VSPQPVSHAGLRSRQYSPVVIKGLLVALCTIGGTLLVLAWLFYQLCAMGALFDYWGWAGWVQILAFGVLFLLAPLLILVPFAAFFGAWLGWDWHWLTSLLFALGPVAVLIPLMLLSGMAEIAVALFKRLRRPTP
jgi:hypothetical protein